MISFQIPQLMVNASADAYSVSQYLAYIEETVDGETKNRIWSFFPIYSLTNLALLPLTVLFPVINIGFVLLGSALLLGSIFYLASIAQGNQIAKNAGELDKITTLPWGLHENTYLTKTALFLSENLAYPLLAFYGASLVACLFLGAQLYACASLAMYALDQLYQHGYIPEFLEKPYLSMSVILVLLVVFGITSPLGITLSLAMIVFTAIDYVRRNRNEKSSPTAQFPMSDKSKQISLTDKTDVKLLLETHQVHRNDTGIHVTFDHFDKSTEYVNNLFETAKAKAEEVDYEKYMTLFDNINFKDETFLTDMQNEMCVHDKFNGKRLSEHCQALGLPLNTERAVVQEAYLKQEMRYFVERLKQSSFRDFTYIQIDSMHGYATLLLSKIEACSPDKQASLLLAIATTTGSHCLRAYLENLSSIASQENMLFEPSMSFQDEAILTIQAVREDAFRAYYYQVTDTLKNKSTFFVRLYFSIVWADENDYFTYEDFVFIFGPNFYLMNANFTPNFREITTVMFDAVMAFVFSFKAVLDFVCGSEQILFNDYYTVDYLVKQAINPGKKLFNIFDTWCRAHQVELLDEDQMLIPRDQAELEALAELMLLDLNIVELDKPYEPQAVSRHAFFKPTPLSTDNVVPSSDNDEQSDINHVNA
jgi:hypothetical protein